MAERPVKVPLPTGQFADGAEVPVEETTERWTDVTLEDGTLLRVKTTVLSATRVAGQWDPEGNPLYFIKSAPVVMIVSSPDSLKRKVQ
jgi:hypothetical protein